MSKKDIKAELLKEARQIYQETGIIIKQACRINIKTGEAVKITAGQIKKYILS